jgi:transmembrane sensor
MCLILGNAVLMMASACRQGKPHGNRQRTEGGISTEQGTRFENRTDRLQRITLPDGSQLALSPGSVVVLAKGFGTGNRDVDLDGEVLFEVNAAAGKPFVVHTVNLRIEVLGTRFRVDAVRKRAGEEVDLLEGRLKVAKTYHSDTDNEPEMLEAGEMLMINREIDLMEKEKMSPAELEKVRDEVRLRRR